MQPVARGHTADANVPAAQNFLPNKRDHNGVINIVVCRIAGCDVFKRKLGDKTDDVGIAGLQRSICSLVHRPKFADEGFYNYRCSVEHANSTSLHGHESTGRPKIITRARTLRIAAAGTVAVLARVVIGRILEV
jgi:hypothetical protein